MILITGVAGFIGFSLGLHLLESGYRVIGLDNLNDYYDVTLKKARLRQLQAQTNFEFLHLDLSDAETLKTTLKSHPEISHCVHLAAQAGVRYSLENPYAYIQANVTGHIALLEALRNCPKLEHTVYASSSSVYGANEKLPFAPFDPVETPMSIYAATKRADELFSYSYSHLYQIPLTGLRFFTVYGPWGRPDMAAYLFTKALFAGSPIRLFNQGAMKRNFTYIDDIVYGIEACLFSPPRTTNLNQSFHRLYNLGNDKTCELMTFVKILEELTGHKANWEPYPMQAGEVPATLADISKTKRDFGFEPKTDIETGLAHFVTWYRAYHHV